MKKILLIGSTGFIGKGVVDSDLMSSYTIFKAGRSKDGVDFQLDFNEIHSFEELIFGEIKFDCIVFAQGINPSKNLKDMSFEHFQSMLNINLTGPALLLKKLINNLASNACIIFLGSVAASQGSYDPSYATAKAGLFGLMKSLTREFAHLRFNILTLGLVEESTVYHQMTSDFRQKHADRMHNGKLISIDQVINSLKYIIENDNINNTELSLTGGI